MDNNSTKPNGTYRKHLPNLGELRFVKMQNQDAHQYSKSFKNQHSPPWLYALWQHWQELSRAPFQGITNNGKIRTPLFTLQDEGMPIREIVDASQVLLQKLSMTQKERVLYHIDSPEWRTWSNPEFLLSDKGIRLDEVDAESRQAVLNVLRATLSPEGYDKAVGAMRINGFLGSLVQASGVCNEFSYNFAFFGAPSQIHPWGFSFYGHHLCINVFLYRTQIVISPWFTGAEPNEIDEGPYAGTTILRREEILGLELMQSLSPEQQSVAQVYKQMKDPRMPPGRWNRDDQRHLCGAFRDNRVVPYEGILVSSMTPEQIVVVTQILDEYLLYLPRKPRQLRLSQAQDFFHETYFCWIGGFTDDDAFYYRIQSPVIIIEFDHHSGVFLTNEQPAKFHIHTLLRTPNGGDYGKALIPLMPLEEQAFVWEQDEVEKENAKLQGHQVE